MCIRQSGHAKLRGSNCHCRRTKKTSATVVNFLRHDSSIPPAVSAITLPRIDLLLFGDRVKLVTANRSFLISALQSLHAESADHGIATLRELGDLPLVEGHRNQLQQVVFNLVRNAFEAMQITAKGKRVLRVTIERRGNAAVAIVVEDSGPGSNPAQLDSIFSAFVTTKSNGMGLGLAICRQIVEYHDGKLFASSGSSGGAKFQVVLPIGPTDGASAYA
jgi:signal transduction histidine kinase